MKFFKPEDFDREFLNTATSVTTELIAHSLACEIANTKLEREGKVVESVLMDDGSWYASTNGCMMKTHKALLINIEPIEACNHPKEKVRPDCTIYVINGFTTGGENHFRCECGAKLKPLTFEEIK